MRLPRMARIHPLTTAIHRGADRRPTAPVRLPTTAILRAADRRPTVPVRLLTAAILRAVRRPTDPIRLPTTVILQTAVRRRTVPIHPLITVIPMNRAHLRMILRRPCLTVFLPRAALIGTTRLTHRIRLPSRRPSPFCTANLSFRRTGKLRKTQRGIPLRHRP